MGYQSYQSYQIFDYFLKKNIIIQYYIINITNIVLCNFLKHTSYCALDGNASQEIIHDIPNRNTNKMKFDHVIMNPPYCRNLHLKILNEAMCYSDDIVNLSPIRWLQDPIAERKRNSDFNKFENVRNHIESLDVITDVEAQILFSAGFLSDLCIYHLTDKGGFAIKENTIIKKIINKSCKTLKDVLEENKVDGWRVRLSEMRPAPSFAPNSNVYINFTYYTTSSVRSWVYKDGYTPNGETYWTNHNTTKGSRDKSVVGDPLPLSIKFNTQEEAVNFENSTKTRFHRYMISKMKTDAHFPFKFVPWLGDYTRSWTDKDLYEYFNLTPEEIAIIESEIQ